MGVGANTAHADGVSSAMRRASLLLVLLVAGCRSDADRLVGTWELADGADARRYSFFADGTARILVPPDPSIPGSQAQAFPSSYTLADSVLTLSDEQGAERFVVRVSDDTLRLRVPEAPTSTVLVRAGG